MAEDKLVFVDSLLREDEGQRPFHFVIKGESLIDILVAGSSAYPNTGCSYL